MRVVDVVLVAGDVVVVVDGHVQLAVQRPGQAEASAPSHCSCPCRFPSPQTFPCVTSVAPSVVALAACQVAPPSADVSTPSAWKPVTAAPSGRSVASVATRWQPCADVGRNETT